MLIGYPLTGEEEGNRWSVHNLGDGTATEVVVEALVQGHGDVPGMTFVGEVSEPIHGKSTAPVEFPKRTWPAAWNTYRDYPDVYVWEGATARARWVDSSGRAHFRPIQVKAPLPSGEPF
ncbi:hypothetical protein DCE94_02140 [Agromyces badenianii]|nr:hypothetical protein DCE94_02140 [Agromyces badenianii]